MGVGISGGEHTVGRSPAPTAVDAPREDTRALLERVRDSAERRLDHPIDLAGARLIDEDLTGIDFRHSDLSGADLSRADLSGANLASCNLRGAILYQAKLEGAELLGADLADANLNECSARRTGFGGVDLSGATLRGSDLEGAVFSQATARGANFTGTKLAGARLRDSDLTDAQFAQANLTDSDLENARVGGAAFDGTDFRRARLHAIHGFERASWIGVDIRDVDFSGTYMLRRFIMDENYLHEFRTRDRFSEFVYRVWWITSDCGRSFTRWAAWTVMIAVLFAGLFSFVEIDYGDYPTSVSPLYYSVVTLTTLGYGDVLPASAAAQMLIVAQVIVGYIALGGLLSIFANKMGRRAD